MIPRYLDRYVYTWKDTAIAAVADDDECTLLTTHRHTIYSYLYSL